MADTGKLGGKLGPRLATLTHQAMSAHLRASADTRARIQTLGTLGVFKTMTAESRFATAPIYRRLVADPELPEEMRALLGFMTGGTGELQAVLSALSTAQAMTPGLGQLIANDLGPVIQNLIERNPHSLLDPGTAARAVVSGLWSAQHGELEAARGGVSANRFETLVALAVAFPDLATALELQRRGEVARQDVENWLGRQGFDDNTVHHLLTLERVHLQPADAADMTLRGIMTRAEGHAVARVNGLDVADFDKLALAVGEPPAIEELLFLYRRGVIDRAKLDHGIRQSRVRDEWIPEIEALRHRPMDVSSAVAAVVQGHLSDGAGAKIAEENGLEPDHWRPLVETHGRPPGIEQMTSLYNRGVISKARLEQAIRESDVKDKYIPDLVEIRRHLLPERTVVSMHSKGALSDAEALAHLLQLGIARADAEALVHEGAATRTAGQRSLAEGTIVQLYEAQTIDRSQAHKALLALGYAEAEVAWILSFAELRRVHSEREHAIAAVRARYVSHHVDVSAAQVALDRLAVPAAERDRLLGLWDTEREVNARQLTEAQVIKAMKKQLLDENETAARLERMGYSADDAALLIASA